MFRTGLIGGPQQLREVSMLAAMRAARAHRGLALMGAPLRCDILFSTAMPSTNPATCFWARSGGWAR
eukprot:6356565-Pyramimonas_sp.AAC.1